MRPLAEEDLEPLISMVKEDRGIDLSRYKDRFLRRRISVRLRASGAQSFGHFLKLLQRDRGEYDSFISAVTVNTSGFFRNRDCYDILERTVLPELAATIEASGRRPPYFWSVGCSRGEEAYSLALLAMRFPFFASWAEHPIILAGDIDEDVLRHARKGIYGSRSMNELSLQEQAALFERQGRQVKVPDRIRRMVAFLRQDIFGERPPGTFFLILCRNLLIYFEREAQEQLLNILETALQPGGYLVLGKSEILIGGARDRFVPVSAAGRIYRKIAGSGAPDAERGWRRKA